MELFFRDIKNENSISWNKLVLDLNNIQTYNPYCYHFDFYNIFLHFISSLLLRRKIILLDSDFTQQELTKLTGYSNFETFSKKISNNIVLKDKQDLIQRLNEYIDDWQIILYTSGTTGLPKKVSHDYNSISRAVKVNERRNNDVWGFAYNPTHMAGVQVFLQALLNGNSIIRLFGLSKELIFREINENQITNISATPSFFRLLFPYEKICTSVLKITSGGEKFDKKNIDLLKNIFPKSSFTNIYASTEAGSIFSSEGSLFMIKDDLKELIKIENNELFIHNSLMGKTEIVIDEWYNTGDIVEVVNQNPIKFKFITRNNEIINVGGYKVNPSEIENVFRNIEGIIDIRVFSKANKILGNIICSEVVVSNKKLSEEIIRRQLQDVLQEFKIPRIIIFVDSISTTRSGKIKR